MLDRRADELEYVIAKVMAFSTDICSVQIPPVPISYIVDPALSILANETRQHSHSPDIH
jgi:hypothetical protein